MPVFAQKTDGDISFYFHRHKISYIVFSPSTILEKRITSRLADYMSRVLGKETIIVPTLVKVPGSMTAVFLNSKKNNAISSISVAGASPEAFSIQTKNIQHHPAVIASGNTVSGLKRAIQKLILRSIQDENGLRIPAMNISESPWIPQREWTICPWAPERVRSAFANPEADKKLNIWLYSDQQIRDYVEMFDWFGFNGCQLMETSANYAATGSVESFRDRQIKFAKAIRENGQHVSYWVWAAQFDDFGWYDPEVVYKPAKGNTAFNDPQVRKVFEKYYNGYAEMAPYVDLLIAHFYDPGSLTSRKDVFSYLGLLQKKFKEKNASIKMGVDFWAAGSPAEYMKQLIDHGFGSSLLLEMSLPYIYPGNKREELHEAAKKLDLQMGMWGWYMTEYETDQMPMMHVNAMALKDFYQKIRNGAHRVHPFTYWSEMEAYHLNNIFSMYASAQLLWNPARDADEILAEISGGIWGPRNGPIVLEALKLIQDTRSGPTWNTFWWTTKEYRLGTADPKSDSSRAADLIMKFENLKTDTSFVPKFPLPFPPATFIDLTLPHLRQIKAFAEFRIRETDIRNAAAMGVSKESLTTMINEAWKPVPDYNTWIGSFGQPEETMQQKMINKLADDLKLNIQMPGTLRYRNANRYLQRVRNLQRKYNVPFRFNIEGSGVNGGEFMWPASQVKDYTELLMMQGVFQKVSVNSYQLTGWEEYKMKR
jgi:hypothetical protein